MAHEAEALLLRTAIQAGLLDAEKGAAALVLFTELKKRGAAFPFGEFLVERGLISRVGLEGLERNLTQGAAERVRTISRLDRFLLLDLLGEGESGSVFRAREEPGGRMAAVKILSPRLAREPEALERFLAEGRICVRLRHPNLVQALRVARTEGLYYVAMELVEGGSARVLLEKSGGLLPETRALEIVGDVALALEAAHAGGLVHRDVKPGNILLTQSGQAKLADLGLAAPRSGRPAAAPGETGPQEVFWGTPDYMPPEVIEGRAASDPRSDLYSLGCTLYEFLTGRPPYLGATPAETFRFHLHKPVPDVRLLRPDVTPQCAALLTHLLAKDPARRFPDARTVVEAIQLLASASAARAKTKAPPSAAPTSSARKRKRSSRDKPGRKKRPAKRAVRSSTARGKRGAKGKGRDRPKGRRRP